MAPPVTQLVLPEEKGLVLLLARLLAAAPDAAARDGARALALATEAVAGDASLTAAETLAMALAEQGRTGEAVAWQRAAVAAIQRSGREKRAEAAGLLVWAIHDRGSFWVSVGDEGVG